MCSFTSVLSAHRKHCHSVHKELNNFEAVSKAKSQDNVVLSGALAILLLGVVKPSVSDNILRLLHCHFRWSTFSNDVNLYIY